MQYRKENPLAENRVLSLCFSKKPMDKDNLPDDLEVISFIILADIIRGTAKSTIEYFQEQNVEIKIISGDHPFTVSKIAERAGVKNASRHIDLSTLTSDEEVINAADKYTVFGRVNPQQKKILVHTLKESRSYSRNDR